MTSREREAVVIPPQRAARTSEDGTRASSGDVLPASLASDVGARFGVDFSDVRVHRDGEANEQAKQQGAQAFTLGSDISFAAGKYDPQTAIGRELLARELAHVVQQRRGGSDSATKDSESRANRAASDVASGQAVNAAALGGAPVGVQMKPGDGKDADAPPPKQDSADVPQNGAHSFSKVLDNFALDRDTLTKSHQDSIDSLAFSTSLHVGMLARGKARIEIVGHADTTGPDPHNMDLGQQRADRVREALARALTPKEGGNAMDLDWSVRSAGEHELLIPTKDNTLEPRNRAVEVRVTIESQPAPAEAPKAPDLNLHHDPIPPAGPLGPRRQDDDLWKRMDETQKKIDQYDRAHPRKNQSAQDVVVNTVMDQIVDPILKKLPLSKSLRDKARDGIKSGIEAGTEKVCDAAIDGAGITGQEATALKAACKSAIKAKPGATNK